MPADVRLRTLTALARTGRKQQTVAAIAHPNGHRAAPHRAQHMAGPATPRTSRIASAPAAAASLAGCTASERLVSLDDMVVAVQVRSTCTFQARRTIQDTQHRGAQTLVCCPLRGRLPPDGHGSCARRQTSRCGPGACDASSVPNGLPVRRSMRWTPRSRPPRRGHSSSAEPAGPAAFGA